MDLSPLKPGAVVEKYTIEAELGRGGTAVVYKARHAVLGTHHAVKVLLGVGVRVRQRLLREGQVQARLRHPNVVPVTDVIEVDGAPGLVAEFVDGPTLERWLWDQQGTRDERLALFRQILDGVEAAHKRGIIHRDLKPSNVLLEVLDDGGLCARVSDFGLARMENLEGDELRTRAQTMMGTPAYMAPEQFRDAAQVDHRADIFALGCILYDMATDQRAFPQADVLDIGRAASMGDYTPPDVHQPDLPAAVVAAIEGALRPRADDRFASIEALRAVLDGRAQPQPMSLPTMAPDDLDEPPGVHPTIGPEDRGDVPPTALAPGPPTPRPPATPTLPPPGPNPTLAPPVPSPGGVLPVTTPSLDAPAPRRRRPLVLLAAVGAVVLLGVALRGLGDAGEAAPGAAAPGDASPRPVAPPADPGTPAAAAAAAGDGTDATPARAAPRPAEAPAPAPQPAPRAAPAPAPAPEAAPEPEAAPAPAPAPARAPAPAPATASVRFGGGAQRVTLVDARGGRHQPGAVPPGSYKILATFSGVEGHAGDLQAEAGAGYVLQCSASFQQCTVERQ